MPIRASGYTTEQISLNQEKTPEGFLLCRNVALARTGRMLYGPNELQSDDGEEIKPGPDGVIWAYREAEDVFSLTAIASALGKPITNEHPYDDVTPVDWKEKAIGIVLNVRRGENVEDDLLLADLLFTTDEGIELILSGTTEISLGYSADYEEIGQGKVKQTNIIINHCAVVEHGRCGSRCAIKDKKLEDKIMTEKSKTGIGKFMDLLFRARKAKDDDEFKKIVDEAMNEPNSEVSTTDEPADGETHIHVHTGMDDKRTKFTDDALEEHVNKNEQEHAEFRSRLEALEGKKTADEEFEKKTDDAESEVDQEKKTDDDMEEFIKDEAPEDIDGAVAAKAKDSRYLIESLRDVISKAEILAPGIRLPTHDSRSKPIDTAKSICALRRKALDSSFKANPELLQWLGVKTLNTKDMTCSAARILFNAAAGIKANENNNQVKTNYTVQIMAQKTPLSLEEINAANRKYYAN